MTDFDNSDRGALWTRDKKNPKAPDMGGEFVLSSDTVQYLLGCITNGQEAKIEVSAWRKEAAPKPPFLSCAIKIPFSARTAHTKPSKPHLQEVPKPESYGESIADKNPWE